MAERGGKKAAGRKRRLDARVMFSEEEMAALAERMAEAGQTSRGRFIRKMALDGRVARVDAAAVAELLLLVRSAANNINQLAKRANTSGAVAARDVGELRRQVRALKRAAESAVERLTAALVD